MGAAMGSPVSAVVANLYMEFLRSWLLSQHPPGPGCGSSMWMTYAASLEKVIKFTMEVEEGGSLLRS